MTSQIDATKPTQGEAFTADVRDNFQTAADEITALQDALDGPVSVGPGFDPLPDDMSVSTVITDVYAATLNGGIYWNAYVSSDTGSDTFMVDGYAGMLVVNEAGTLQYWVAQGAAGTPANAEAVVFEIDSLGNVTAHNELTVQGGANFENTVNFQAEAYLAFDPRTDLEAATKQYVDAAVENTLPLTGGELTGPLTIASETDPTLYIKSTTLEPGIAIEAQAGQAAYIWSSKNDLGRWEIDLGEVSAETGGNTGTNFQIVSYDDAGNNLATVLYISRATGLIALLGDPVNPLEAATKQYVDAAVAPLLARIAELESRLAGTAPGMRPAT